MEVEIGRGKKARRAYGFDDIAIVPSRRTRDPDDVDITWKLGDYRFELPLMASAMDGVVSPTTAGIVGKLGGLAVLNLEGIWIALRGRRRAARAHRAASRRSMATREMQEIYQRPIDPELMAQRIREIKEQGVVVAASLTPQRVREYYELALDAGLDILVIQGTVVSAEHVSSVVRAAQPQGVHPRGRRAGRRGRLRLVPHGPAPHAHRRGRRARRRRPGRGVHDARRAGHRRPAGDGDRRRRGGPLAAHARDRRVLAGHRRRRHAQRRRRRQGDRLRRRRGDDRLAAGARLRGARATASTGAWRRSTRRSRAARACRRCRTARSRRSSSAPRARTTARSTCSAACAPRWRRAATRTSRSSTGPS